MPGKSVEEVAETLVWYFNAVSYAFDPFSIGQTMSIAKTSPNMRWQIGSGISGNLNPWLKSNLFPQLMTTFCNFLAIPLADNYNV